MLQFVLIVHLSLIFKNLLQLFKLFNVVSIGSKYSFKYHLLNAFSLSFVKSMVMESLDDLSFIPGLQFSIKFSYFINFYLSIII